MAETQGFKARVEYEVTDGTQLLYTFPFSYLRKKFIKVDVLHADNYITSLTYGVDYVVNDLSLTLTNPVKVGEHLIIYRQTTTDKIITWNDGSILLASDMNTEDVQMLHLQEEQQDYIQSHSIATKTNSDTKEVLWDALKHRVVNVSDPIDPQDVVTKNYMENVQGGFVSANTKILNEAKDTLSATQQTQSKAQTNESLSKAWATSTESPDNADDTQSNTGMTQSSRSWALYSEGKAQEAATSEAHAKTSETNAKTSETEALASERNAMTSEANAKKSATEALASEQNAMTSATNAKAYATNAKTSEQNAKASEVKSSASEANAKVSETHAKDFATNASVSLANAIGSENNARDSETKAATSEAHAKTSETNAKDSETKAATSEANAKVSEINAKDSEVKASVSEANAKVSETNAKAWDLEAQSKVEALRHLLDIKDDIARMSDFRYIARNTAYSSGLYLYTPSLGVGYIIFVLKAGTTSSEEPNWSSIASKVSNAMLDMGAASSSLYEPDSWEDWGVSYVDGTATLLICRFDKMFSLLTRMYKRNYYMPKDHTFNLETFYGVGYLTGGGKKLYFNIPLSKPVHHSVSSVTARITNLILRGDKKYYLGSASQGVDTGSAELPNVSASVTDNWIYIIADINPSSTPPSNIVVGVACGISITFNS